MVITQFEATSAVSCYVSCEFSCPSAFPWDEMASKPLEMQVLNLELGTATSKYLFFLSCPVYCILLQQRKIDQDIWTFKKGKHTFFITGNDYWHLLVKTPLEPFPLSLPRGL